MEQKSRNGLCVPGIESFPMDISLHLTGQNRGTAHAVLCAKSAVQEPFAVINADDFYGRDAFVKAYEFLTTACTDSTYSIIGYDLSKTLSENGSVSRGVCEVDKDNNLVSIHERTKIYRNDKGEITYEEGGKTFQVPDTAKVSMNFWCFDPSVFTFIEKIEGVD
jgi:UTP-glucose-1-phosphate uridylyltransferase